MRGQVAGNQDMTISRSFNRNRRSGVTVGGTGHSVARAKALPSGITPTESFMAKSTRSPRPKKSPAADRPRLFRTQNDLPAAARVELCGLLNQRLADCIDLQTQCKQAHWNVKGPSFIALHKLFDEINEAVEEYVDLLAERVVQLGGVAEGTARVVAGYLGAFRMIRAMRPRCANRYF